MWARGEEMLWLAKWLEKHEGLGSIPWSLCKKKIAVFMVQA